MVYFIMYLCISILASCISKKYWDWEGPNIVSYIHSIHRSVFLGIVLVSKGFVISDGVNTKKNWWAKNSSQTGKKITLSVTPATCLWPVQLTSGAGSSPCQQIEEKRVDIKNI